MATLTDYKGLDVVEGATGDGGIALTDNFKSLADWTPKSVWAESADPNVNDDEGDDFYPGSCWLRTDTTPPKLFVCKSSASGAAVWLQVQMNPVDLASNVSGALPVANGGTGATTAANARTNLALGSSSNVQFNRVGVGAAPTVELQVQGPASASANIYLSCDGSDNNSDNFVLFKTGSYSTERTVLNRYFSSHTTRADEFWIDHRTGGNLVSTLRFGNGFIDVNTGNFAIGGATFGTSAARVAAFKNGTAPSTSPTDTFQMYSSDITAGNAAPHFRTEGGAVVKLYQQSNIAGPTGGGTQDTEARAAINSILSLLQNNGLMA